MKRITFFLILICCSLPVLSQDSIPFTDRRNEFNIGYFNAFELNRVNELGVGYKRIIKKGAIRTGTGFGFNTTEHDEHKTEYISISPWIGYEFHQYFNRFQLHYGLDIFGNYGNSVSENYPEDPIMYSKNQIITKGWGMRPMIGLRVFINKTISISTETYMEISRRSIKTEYMSEDYSNTSTRESVYAGLGPLGIFSINIHF